MALTITFTCHGAGERVLNVKEHINAEQLTAMVIGNNAPLVQNHWRIFMEDTAQ